MVSEVILRGRDTHHRPLDVISGRHGWLFVEAAYHAMHHIHRENYISSYTTLFDRIMGTSCQLAGRRVAMTGASGKLGAAFKRLLEREGVASVKPLHFAGESTFDDFGLEEVLRETDILVLCHGTNGKEGMEANCHTSVALIERFKELAKNRRLPAEIWAFGSESEILHIVPSERFSGETVANVGLFMIRRGFRYVPVTCTGLALLNFFKFFLFVKPAKASRTAESVCTEPVQSESFRLRPEEEMAGALR